MVRVAALAFVLRAGIKCSPSQLSSRFRTIQAKIDTILYQRLIIAEKLIDKWKHMSLDEDSDDDFDPNTDHNKPEYRNKEVFLRR